MAIIEKAIHEHFAHQARSNPEPAASELAENRPLVSRPVVPLDIPFAKVNSIISGSPADDAGLKAGDEIRNFGYVNQSNHDGLKRVAECVQGNEGVGSFPVCWDSTEPPILGISFCTLASIYVRDANMEDG
jgi:26S proteasome non-ATPase regulatory subunit 9